MTLEELLKMGVFVVTSEFGSQADIEKELLSRENVHFQGWADGIRLNRDISERYTSEKCVRLKEMGMNVELEVRVRDFNRLEIAQNLLNASAAGIDNILLFSRDYCISGESLHEALYFRVDTEKFFSVVQSLERGVSLEGDELGFRPRFFVGAVADHLSPEHAWKDQIREMEVLVENGVGYFVTRPVFDLEPFAGFIERTKHLNTPVIAEIVPVPSAGEAMLLNSMSWADIPPAFIDRLQKAEERSEQPFSVTIALIERLTTVCAGIHIVALTKEPHLLEFLKSLKKV